MHEAIGQLSSLRVIQLALSIIKFTVKCLLGIQYFFKLSILINLIHLSHKKCKLSLAIQNTHPNKYN